MKNLIFCISFLFQMLLLVFIVSFQSNYLFAQNFSNIQKVVEAPRSFPSNRDNHFGHSVSIDGNFAIVGVPGDNSAGNTFGGVAYIYEKINTGWVLQNANALQVDINLYIAQIRQLDSLYSLNGNSQHLAQIDVLQDSLSSKAAQENLIWSNIQNTRDNTATLLDIDNSNIAVAAIFEDNEKKVNEVYLNSIAKGIADYTADQLAILQFVAGQCPWEGGNAVFRSRGMLALVQRVIINDESMCEAKSLPEQGYDKETTEGEVIAEEEVIEMGFIKIYPNPTSNLLNIEGIDEVTISSIEIFSLAGQKLIQLDNNKERQYTQVEVGLLEAGLYICRVITTNSEIHSFKFSVVK